MASAATNISNDLQLFTAAREGNRTALQALLQAATAIDLESKHGEDEQTALIVAAAEGHVECLSDLLKAGANVEGVDVRGSTALMYACWKRHKACVLTLLATGAVVSASNSEGMTALHNAVEDGGKECVTARVSLYSNRCLYHVYWARTDMQRGGRGSVYVDMGIAHMPPARAAGRRL